MNLGALLDQRAKRLAFYKYEVWQHLQKPIHKTMVAIMQCLQQAEVPLSTKEIASQLELSASSVQPLTLHGVGDNLHWQSRHGLVVHCGVHNGLAYWRLHDFGREVLACGPRVVSPAPPTNGVGGVRRSAGRYRKYDWETLGPRIAALRAEGKRNVQIEQLLGLSAGIIGSHEAYMRHRSASLSSTA